MPKSIFFSIESLYLDLAECCIVLNKFEECLYYSCIGLKIVNNFMELNHHLEDVKHFFGKNNKLTKFFLDKFSLVTSQFHFLIGNCLKDLLLGKESYKQYKRAKEISSINLGQRDELTIKYEELEKNCMNMQNNFIAKPEEKFGNNLKLNIGHKRNKSHEVSTLQEPYLEIKKHASLY